MVVHHWFCRLSSGTNRYLITLLQLTFTPHLPCSHHPAQTIWILGELLQKIQLDEVILRWKKTTRALKIYEQEYGKTLTNCLEKRTDAELVYFHDPVEAAAFFCLVELMKTKTVQ